MARSRELAIAIGMFAVLGLVGGDEVRLHQAAAQQGLPQCAEDEAFLVGRGDFDGNRYERYTCLHPEDLTREAKREAGIGAAVAEAVCEHQRYWLREQGIGPVVSEACE